MLAFENIHNSVIFKMRHVITNLIKQGYSLMRDYYNSEQRDFILRQGHEIICYLEEEMDIIFRKSIEEILRKNKISVNIWWKSDFYLEPKIGGSQNPSDPWVVALYDWCDGGTNFIRKLLYLVKTKKGQPLTPQEINSFTSNSTSLLTFSKKTNGSISRPMVSVIYSMLYRKTYSHFREDESVNGSIFVDGQIQTETNSDKARVGMIRIVIPRYVNYLSKYIGIFQSEFEMYLRKRDIPVNCSIATGSSANDLTMLAEGEVDGYIDLREKLPSLNPKEDACLQEEDVISIKEYLSRKGVYVAKTNHLTSDVDMNDIKYNKKNSINLVALNQARLSEQEFALIKQAIDIGLYEAMRQFSKDKSFRKCPKPKFTISEFICFKHSDKEEGWMKDTEKLYKEEINFDNSALKSEIKYIIDTIPTKVKYKLLTNKAIINALFEFDEAESLFINAFRKTKFAITNHISENQNKSTNYLQDYKKLMELRRDLSLVCFNYSIYLKRLLDKQEDSQKRILQNRVIDLLSTAVETNPLRIDNIIAYADILSKDNQDSRARLYVQIAEKLVNERERHMNKTPPLQTKSNLYRLGVQLCYGKKKVKFEKKLKNLFLPKLKQIWVKAEQKNAMFAKELRVYLAENIKYMSQEILEKFEILIRNIELKNFNCDLNLVFDAVVGISDWNIISHIGCGHDKNTLKVIDSVIGKDRAALKILNTNQSREDEIPPILDLEQISDLSGANPNLVYTHSPGKYKVGGKVYYYYIEELFDRSLSDELARQEYSLKTSEGLNARINLFFKCFGQMIDGLKSCHEAKYVYDGLKAENILIKNSTKFRVALCDFSAMVNEDYTGKSKGSKLTMPLELMQGSSPTYISDIFRVIAESYHILFGFYPFANNKQKPKNKEKREMFNKMLIDNAKKKDYSYLFDNKYNKQFSNLPESLKTPIRNFLDKGLKPCLKDIEYKNINEVKQAFEKIKQVNV